VNIKKNFFLHKKVRFLGKGLFVVGDVTSGEKKKVANEERRLRPFLSRVCDSKENYSLRTRKMI